MKVREAINQAILEEQVIAEANNVTVYTFMLIPQIKNIDDLINKVMNLTINIINDNYLTNKVTKLTTNVGNKNNLIKNVANMTINNVGNDLE